VVGKVKEAVGGGEHSALANEILGLLSSGSERGGLQGVIQSFKDRDLATSCRLRDRNVFWGLPS
jgi:hypothetical protein